MTPARTLVCTAGCGIPLHPAAVEGTNATTHPSCDPTAQPPPKPEQPLADVLPFPAPGETR